MLGLLGLAFFATYAGAETVAFNCVRVEHDITEEYLLQIVSGAEGSKDAKAKVYFDHRDLDQVSSQGLLTWSKSRWSK